jgi:predicted RNA-binding Zn-ribbon protein involved in translation (DUF1610 family)
MAISQAEIKRAISLLSTVGEEEISGMEPEFFAAYARFSSSYKSHIEKQIATDNAKEWALSKLPPCPKCGERTITICSPVINLSSVDTYSYTKSRTIGVGSDIFDSLFFRDNEYEKLVEVVQANCPEIAHLLEDHLSCYECSFSYPASKEIEAILGQEIPFSTIVEWVNSKNSKD